MEIRVQVSDGKDISDPHILYVSAVPLSITLQVNTGNLLCLYRDQMTYKIRCCCNNCMLRNGFG